MRTRRKLLERDKARVRPLGTARFVVTLVDVDGPQLVLFNYGKQVLLGLAVPGLGQEEFFCVGLPPNAAKQYFAEEADLYYFFTHVRLARRYVTRFDQDTEKFYVYKFTGDTPANFLPARGFFARSHTSDYHYAPEGGTGRERLLLDGAWELQEFGRFQQVYAEVYSFSATTDLISEGTASKKILDLFKKGSRELPYAGGGSYLSFFRSLAASLSPTESVRLVSISKASPGNMILSGEDDDFEETRTIIESYLNNRYPADEKYKLLHQTLKNEKLLRVDISQFSPSDSRSQLIFEMSDALYSQLGFKQVAPLKLGCAGNALAFAKIALGFYRRVAAAAEYFAQGRVAFA